MRTSFCFGPARRPICRRPSGAPRPKREAEVIEFPSCRGAGPRDADSRRRSRGSDVRRRLPVRALEGQAEHVRRAALRADARDRQRRRHLPVGLVRSPGPTPGNSALEFQVTGLPKQQTGSYYELWLTRHGEPWVSCGTFRMKGRTTTVRFSVPYTLSHYSGWIVTGVTPAQG